MTRFETTEYYVDVNAPAYVDRFKVIGLTEAKTLFAAKYREFFRKPGHWIGIANENEDADDVSYSSGLNEQERLEFEELESDLWDELSGGK